MEDGITVSVPGVRDLIAELKELREDVRYRKVRGAIREIGRFITLRLRANAPLDKGKLRANIDATTRWKSRSGVLQAKVRISTRGKADDPRNAFYWKIITSEGGFRPRRGSTVVAPNDFIKKTQREVERPVAQMFFAALERALNKRGKSR